MMIKDSVRGNCARPEWSVCITTPSFVRDRRTWALYLLLALFAFLETILGPAMPYIRSRLDLDYTIASLHFSAFALGGVLVGFLGDRVVQRWGRHNLLWGGIAGMVAGITLFTISPVVVGTLLGAFATGWFGTLALVANQSSLSDLHGERRTIAIAESNVAASTAAVLAPLAIGGFDALGLGWQTAPLLAIPLFALLAWKFHEASIPVPSAPSRCESGQTSLLPSSYWIFWSVLFMVSAVEWCVAYWGADYLDTEVGLSKSTAATAMSIFFGAMVAGRMLGARLARRYPGTGLLLGALALAIFGFPIFWLAPSPVGSLVGLFVAGIGIANFYPLTVAAATSIVPDRADQATARLAISGAGALLTVPLMVGAISDLVGMRWGFGVVLPLLLGAVAATIAGRRACNRTLLKP
jgi:MFS family permease